MTGLLELAAIREFLIACADEADMQRAKYPPSSRVSVRDLMIEAKAYRNAARMIDREDHAAYRATNSESSPT